MKGRSRKSSRPPKRIGRLVHLPKPGEPYEPKLPLPKRIGVLRHIRPKRIGILRHARGSTR